MNKFVKDALIFLGGGTVGAFVSFFITRKNSNKKNEEAIKQMEEYYKNKYGGGNEPYPEKIPEEEPAKKPTEYKTNINEESYIRTKPFKRPANVQNTDYTSYYAASEHPEDDEAEKDYRAGLDMTRESAKSKGPKMIKMADYGSEPNLRLVELFYYTEDDVLTVGEDQNEEIIKDFDEIESMIGDALTKYGFKDNEEETIYVRNLKRGCDYEINKIFGSYGP